MVPIIDMHCDTLSCVIAASSGRETLKNATGHINLQKLREGGSMMQCLAIYVPAKSGEGAECNPRGMEPYDFYRYAVECFKREMQAYPDEIRPVTTAAEIERNYAAGLLSAMLTVEDSMPLFGDMARLEEMYSFGVRMVTLTWNFENSVGYPNRWPETEARGLKPFGIEAVRRMNELGMIVDVSHLSDGGFYDVVKYCKKPFVASHSDARACCNVVRNLTDDMLRLLGETGSLTGINFCAEFLRENSTEGTVEDILRHMKYIKNKAGEGALGLGSDFDGFEHPPEFQDFSGYQQLVQAMERCFTPREIDLFTHQNVLRVIRENCG